VEIVAVSPGTMRAFLPISTENRFFRVRLLSASQTNRLILPREAENQFGNSFVRPRFQQAYPASAFSDAPSDRILITGLAFRVEEGSDGFDATISLKLRMGVFRGPMSDIPRTRYIFLQDGIDVFDQGNVRLTTPAPGSPGSFELRFPLDKSFSYDRKLGQLILQFEIGSATGRLQDFDRMDVASPDDGLILVPQELSTFVFRAVIPTEFSYATDADDANIMADEISK
jgi:hypothetical protein